MGFLGLCCLAWKTHSVHHGGEFARARRQPEEFVDALERTHWEAEQDHMELEYASCWALVQMKLTGCLSTSSIGEMITMTISYQQLASQVLNTALKSIANSQMSPSREAVHHPMMYYLVLSTCFVIHRLAFVFA